MILPCLSLCLAAASLLSAGTAMAGGPGHGLSGGPPLVRPGLPPEAEQLPPNIQPGQCVIRRMTGPGGASRWERVECEPGSQASGLGGYGAGYGSDYGASYGAGYGYGYGYGYGGQPLEVETASSQYTEAYEASRYSYSSGYASDYGSGYGAIERQETRYGPGPSHRVEYRVAGRDAQGFLVWPGKQP
ncbi:hypothetical protein [Caulobacter henricii]|uniref:Uncharacterized protein n=1 Tax=Caulobacter henricii TaxID=69395 RepID=A0A0P0NWV8_9CAUL|nr:hypothetical protein [Caulobacter henricii]ALL12069.1 hypothetical protein AQ619_01125 [Caulobacter henricii]